MTKPDWQTAGGGESHPQPSKADFALECGTATLEFQMDELETLSRLEPNLVPLDGDTRAQLSLAISIKRIADALDRRTPEQRVSEAHVSMVNELASRNAIAKRIGFSKLMKLVGDYFYRRTGIQSDKL